MIRDPDEDRGGADILGAGAAEKCGVGAEGRGAETCGAGGADIRGAGGGDMRGAGAARGVCGRSALDAPQRPPEAPSLRGTRCTSGLRAGGVGRALGATLPLAGAATLGEAAGAVL